MHESAVAGVVANYPQAYPWVFHSYTTVTDTPETHVWRFLYRHIYIAKFFCFCHLKKLVRPETFGPYYVVGSIRVRRYIITSVNSPCK